MKTFKIDPSTGDLVWDAQNNLVMVSGDDEIAQAVERTLTTNLSEWFLEPEFGFARFEVLGNKYNEQQVTDLIYDAVLQETRIQAIEKLILDFDRQTRKLTINMVLLKVDGDELEVGTIVNGTRV